MTRPQPLLSLSRRYLTTITTPRTSTITTTTTCLLRSPQPQPQSRLRTITPRIRAYHSIHHPSPSHPYTNSQTTILSAALHHVPTHGFTRNALTLGARDAGFLDVSVQLFPRAEFDLILFYLASRRGLLRSKVDNDNLLQSAQPQSVDDKIKVLIMERLRMNAEVKEKWVYALAIMSLGENIPMSLSELYALSDDILTLAGDASVDASWYSKRVTIAAVYASSEFMMTLDTSAGLRDTEEFLGRRLAEVGAVGDKLSGVKQCLGFMGTTAVGLGKSWGLKI
ncbi:ubiquinone biosynthesis protein COQ9 [Aspergillus sclerotiicarbonarius CBS 121057]|uniref:Ubiquinone biosynthesis protein n=1 Tax=Aspergillus sclerotiicarbonarius (strain CBS 121057 / IBT 28362) TaxID=1448318 RepID=A0A319DXX0_ASPSB|nr:ubiquinone biosynthesis protein COQ9 [Aspergillus sclerotiicarbonarius CBS 121057]